MRRAAVEAEQARQYDVAYDLYCRSAARNPSNKAAAEGISRMARPAARIWEDRAHQALQTGDYEAAWKHLMRVLTIRPDHPSAAKLLDNLERGHGEAVADARAAWLRGEKDALIVAQATPPAPVADEQPPGEALADAGQQRPAEPEPSGETPGKPPPADSTPAETEATPQPTEEPAHPPVSGRLPVARPPAERPTSHGFLVTAVVSRHDRRYAKMAETLDGLYVKVRDTDSDPDADIEVYRGRKCVAKKKDMRVGDSITAQGSSGRQYEIVIVSIFDRTETVRVGVRPSR